ncbi:MAG: hypothetical protein ACI8PV_001661 [Dinoroseobacter sp.]|jgi:hypothetical protein
MDSDIDQQLQEQRKIMSENSNYGIYFVFAFAGLLMPFMAIPAGNIFIAGFSFALGLVFSQRAYTQYQKYREANTRAFEIEYPDLL